MSDLLKVQHGGNFYIQEFLSPWWANKASSPEHMLKGLQLNNPAMIEGTQLIRDIAGQAVTINNWHSGGVYKESCLRTPHTLGDQNFSLFSGHMFWNCADLKYEESPTDEMYYYILENPEYFYMIIAMEHIEYTRSTKGKLGRDWHHILFGYRNLDTPIKIFKP